MKNLIIQHRVVVALALLLAAMSAFIFHENIFSYVESSELHGATVDYLKRVEKDDLATLSQLVEIKAVVDVFSSFDVGIELFVRAEVGLGKMLDAMSEMLDRAIVVTLASTASVSTLMLGISLVSKLTPWLVGASLVLFSISLLIMNTDNQKVKDGVSTAAHYSIGVLLVFYLVIPYSINFAMHMDSRILADERSERHDSLWHLGNEISTRHADIIQSDNIDKISISDFKAFKSNMTQRTEVVVRYFIHKNISIAFNLLAPLILLFVMWLGLRRMMRSFVL